VSASPDQTFFQRQHRRAVREVARQLERLTVARPRLGLSLSARLADLVVPRLREPFRAPASGLVEAVLGPIEPAEAERIRLEIASQEFRNAALRHVIREQGPHRIERLIERIDAGPLLRLREAGTTVVTVSWHQGPTRAHAGALRRLGFAALLATTNEDPASPEDAGPVRFHRIRRDLSDARFLIEAREALARGELVGLNLDWRQARGAEVVVLGRRIALAGGALWLARTAGARLVPVTRRWLGCTAGIEVTFHEPLPEPRASRADARAFEAELAAAAGAFFDGHLRREPGTLRLSRLRYYARAPRA